MSSLNSQIRDPGGDLRAGHIPNLPLLARPLTRMAASAVTGESGSDIDGYPDYRGVPVVGAWTWLSELELGVTTEIDVEEAYAGLATVRRSFAVIAVFDCFGTRATALRSGAPARPVPHPREDR